MIVYLYTISDSGATSSSSIFIDSDGTATPNQDAWSCKTEEDPVQDIQQDDWEDWRKYIGNLSF